jgi:hypothetical protein
MAGDGRVILQLLTTICTLALDFIPLAYINFARGIVNVLGYTNILLTL